MFFGSLSIYKIIFMVELLVAELLFTFRLGKRSRFVLRFAMVSAACIVVSVFFPVLSYDAIYSSVLFLVLFLVSMAGLMFCYNEKPFNIVYCAIAAYTVRHLSFQLFSLCMTFIDGTNSSVSDIYSGTGAGVEVNGGFFLSLFVFLACYYVVYTLCYTIFARRIGKSGSMEMRNPYMLILVLLILFVDIGLNAVAVYNSVEDNFLNGTVFFTNVVTMYLYNMLCCLFTLFIQFSMIDMNKLKKDLEILNHLWNQERQQYEISKENIDLINLKCHDLKYQVRQIAQGNSGNHAFEEIENLISVYDSMIKTGNEALDVIFTEKSLICRKNGIRLNCMVDGARLSFMDKTDIYVLFGNIVDNAMEAVQKLDDMEKRIISLNVFAENGVLAVNMSNYYEGELVLRDDGLPATTKTDKNFHGLGVKSVCMIVEKYKGDINFSADNGIFRVGIVFPLP